MTTPDRVIPIRSPEQDEIESLRKDAERYRWLRDTADPATWEYISHQNPVCIDIDIDAALSKEG